MQQVSFWRHRRKGVVPHPPKDAQGVDSPPYGCGGLKGPWRQIHCMLEPVPFLSLVQPLYGPQSVAVRKRTVESASSAVRQQAGWTNWATVVATSPLGVVKSTCWEVAVSALACSNGQED